MVLDAMSWVLVGATEEGLAENCRKFLQDSGEVVFGGCGDRAGVEQSASSDVYCQVVEGEEIRP